MFPIVELSVTEPPAQNVVGPPAVIVGARGNGFTVTFTAKLDALSQPLILYTFTVKLPDVVTFID